MNDSLAFMDFLNQIKTRRRQPWVSDELCLSHEASEPVMASSLGVLCPHLRRAYLQLRHEAQHLHRHHQGGQDGTPIHQSVSR